MFGVFIKKIMWGVRFRRQLFTFYQQHLLCKRYGKEPAVVSLEGTYRSNSKREVSSTPPPTTTTTTTTTTTAPLTTNGAAANPSLDDTAVMYDALQDLCRNNAEFFRADDSEYGQRLFEAFRGLGEHVAEIRPLVQEIHAIAVQYDFDEKVPGNGYRSFLRVVDSAVSHGLHVSRKVCYKRDKIIFRKGFFMREVESCNHLLVSLSQCLDHLRTLSKWSSPGDLFPNDKRTPEDLLSQGDEINQYCFYGRCLGFQYCESMKGVLKFIVLCMAGFSEVYYNQGNILSKATSSMWISGRYLLDPELRARRIVNISQHASIDFCKAFWFLAESEIMQRVPRIAASNVSVNKVISIPPESMQYTKVDGVTIIDIPVPTAHIGTGSIQVRLISSVVRQGMIGEGVSATNNAASSVAPPSRGLLFHCHGGGFVAHSSRAHMVYLRDWACLLNIPILSIDYSLAPAAPYPRALEEMVYAYVWALNNYQLLGTTAERIVFAGDSAGANLSTALALKCTELGLRPPDGIFLAYIPVVISLIPSPARMLCLMDPLLPLGFLMRCLKAYASPAESGENGKGKHRQAGVTSTPSTESFEEVSESDLAELQAHKSLGASDVSDTLTNVSLSSQSPNKASAFNNASPNTEWTKLGDNNIQNAELSQRYVSEFDSLVNELDSDGDLENSRVDESSFKHRVSNFVGAITATFTNWAGTIGGPSDAELALNLDDDNLKRSKDEFNFDIPRDPFMSPYWASNESLKTLPPTRILTVQLDPCLDDCVMFAKKLKGLGNDIDLDILEGLPHGFLNFALLSKEAHEGSKKCTKRIAELLDLDSLPEKSD